MNAPHRFQPRAQDWGQSFFQLGGEPGPMLLAQNWHTPTRSAAHLSVCLCSFHAPKIWSNSSLFTFDFQYLFSAIQTNTQTSATLGEDHHTSNTSQERSKPTF